MKCDCPVCVPINPPSNDSIKPVFNVTVKKVITRRWAVKVGSVWIEMSGTEDMSLEELRKRRFSPMEDVRAHPNSLHFEDQCRN